MAKRVIVVGAGLSGIAAAQELKARGHEVLVLERSRGWGGRMATRRVDLDRLDHGAPYFTVRDPSFREALQPLVTAGVVGPWADRLHRWNGTTLTADALTQTERRFAAADGMAAVVRRLGQGLDVHHETAVTGLSAMGGRWHLTVAAGGVTTAEVADVVVVAIPGPEARVLVQIAAGAVDPIVRDELERVTFDPCLVVMAGYPASLPPIAWRGIASTVEPMQWLGLESSKRSSEQRLVTLHATGEWSRENWQLTDSELTTALMQAASPIVGEWVLTPTWAQLKRWSYAKPVLLANGRALLSEDCGPPIAFCGDWCLAPRVEGAFLSGRAAADRLIFAGHL